MNLELTDEQQLLQKSVREFAKAEVKLLAKEIDETGRFPRHHLRALVGPHPAPRKATSQNW